MVIRPLAIVLALPLLAFPVACAAADPDRRPVAEEKTPRPAPPRTAAEFLDRAEAAMRQEPGWRFAVRGREDLSAAGQRTIATYKATADLTREPATFRSRGVITTEGRRRAEWIYLVKGVVYVKESGRGWRRLPAASAAARTKVEDPLRAVETFRSYARQAGGMLSVETEDGQVKLDLKVPRAPVARYGGKEFARAALREFAPTLRQLKGAGVNTARERIRLSGLSETLVLDARTYRIVRHWRAFGFSIPYGNGNIIYSQEVQEKTRAPFRGTITLPRGASA